VSGSWTLASDRRAALLLPRVCRVCSFSTKFEWGARVLQDGVEERLHVHGRQRVAVRLNPLNDRVAYRGCDDFDEGVIPASCDSIGCYAYGCPRKVSILIFFLSSGFLRLSRVCNNYLVDGNTCGCYAGKMVKECSSSSSRISNGERDKPANVRSSFLKPSISFVLIIYAESSKTHQKKKNVRLPVYLVLR